MEDAVPILKLPFGLVRFTPDAVEAGIGFLIDIACSRAPAPTREAGFATVRAHGTRRLYSVDAAPLREASVWLERFRGFWNQRLDALVLHQVSKVLR